MKIFYINNVGSGFAEQIEIEPGTTLASLFAQKMPESKPHDFLIRVNRQPAAADEVLTEGCRVSITPTKIEGARAT
jgi:sulfur carrier protein ThiS